MNRPDRVTFVEVTRPGSDAEIARADAAVADVLRATAWEFVGPHDVRQTIFGLAMLVFSGGTDAQVGDYLRDRDRRAPTPSSSRRREEDYTAAARAVRLAFGAPAV